MSGFCQTVAAGGGEIPGRDRVPSGLKKTRRKPSELKVSTGFFAFPVNALGNDVFASTAATVNASLAALCPRVLPEVLIVKLPPARVQMQKAGGATELHDENPFAVVRLGHEFIGILRAVLRRAAGRDNVAAGGIHHVNVIVVRGARPRGPPRTNSCGRPWWRCFALRAPKLCSRPCDCPLMEKSPPSTKSPSHVPEVLSFLFPEFAADEKNSAPSAVTALTACAITPSWNADSLK